MEIVMDPQLPYTKSIPNFFEPGNRLKVCGANSSETQGFLINLQCNTAVPMDIALQVKVNLVERAVSVNSKQKFMWNEAYNIHNVPFQCAEKFELAVLCDFIQYKIFINDRYICDYPQRISYSCITHLVIEGDVAIEKISYEVAPVAISYPANQLLSTSMPQPIGFNYIDKPPSYNDVLSKRHPQNVICVAGPVPSATTWPLSMSSQSYSSQEAHVHSTGPMAPVNPAISSQFRPVEPSRRKVYAKYGSWVIIIFFIFWLVAAFGDKKTKKRDD